MIGSTSQILQVKINCEALSIEYPHVLTTNPTFLTAHSNTEEPREVIIR